jgi:drug/metabolite transporter (DMT)-like permease
LDALTLGAALLSALLHASWNAAVKAHPQPREAMAAQMITAALFCLPGLWWAGLPPLAAWPWMLLSTTLNMVAVLALLKAYERGGFGTVYPMARATAVLGVAAVAPLLLGERLGLWASVGVGLVAGALMLLALDTRRASTADFQPGALVWTLISGLFTAGYVLADAQGVRSSGSALAYGFTVSILNALAMSWLNRGLGSPWQLLRRHARLALPAGVVSNASYLLILWVFMHAPVAAAAALRDTSAVFAMLIAVWWLKEPLPPRRLAVVALAVAGVPLLRLG